ncbi:uncharacterized protein SHTP_p029 (plasmid) [Mycobacterium ulcerans subsp. shinshuense]|uniref:Uncharacterized protein n=1 Tax=Mycobacterium ulcerans subsp. shinshuense TaxID=1124626 RepID=A0A1B4YA36_MYCUL|nr:uncharacterized protein SHTP_p029 [Mycobacterium ulcerans subsp. shinshuense]
MPFYWIPVADAPFPHAMRRNHTCPFALENVRRHFREFGWTPGQDTYRELYANPDFQRRARDCSAHQGSWLVALPAVESVLTCTPASTAPDEIGLLAKNSPVISALNNSDRNLALSLLDSLDPIRIFRTHDGTWLSNGQHRICAARIAGVSHIPVWWKFGVRPPDGAKPAQPTPLSPG